MSMRNKVFGGLIGLCVGDALGVPVEFVSRTALEKNPLEMMNGYGTHNQPLGTWSDDSSLTFCLMESLCEGYDTDDIAKRFVKWYEEGYWTAQGEVFDIGNATMQAIVRIQRGCKAEEAGGKTQYDNGNGSLMRILPLSFYLLYKNDVAQRFKIVKEVSSITHAHTRSVMACFFYVELAISLIKGKNFDEAMDITVSTFDSLFCDNIEREHFQRILDKNVVQISQKDIYSSGYVIHSLEAALWCIKNSNSYKDVILKAVNLGEDTDTTAAIAGGLAGIMYGQESIPHEWIDSLARKDEILRLCQRFNSATFE